MSFDEIKDIAIEKQNISKLNMTMKNWDKKSVVRTLSRNYHNMLPNNELRFFKMELVPLAFHPFFNNSSIDTQRMLQILQLSRYLYSTEIMETHIVNPALLALQTINFISQEMKVNAWKIYTDEAYHTLMVAELRGEIHKSTGVKFPQLPYPMAQKLVLAEVNKLPSHLKSIGLICVAAVNETLITANLVQARDESLFPFIRQMLTNHAKDEAVHSMFFTDVFTIIWKNINDNDKLFLYHLIPMAIKNFLGLDVQSLKYDVEQFGFDTILAEKIAGEAIEYYLAHSQKFKSSLNSTFKMLDQTSFLDECDFNIIFDGIDVPKSFIKLKNRIDIRQI